MRLTHLKGINKLIKMITMLLVKKKQQSDWSYLLTYPVKVAHYVNLLAYRSCLMI